MNDSLIIVVNSDDLTLGLAALSGGRGELTEFSLTDLPDCEAPNGPSPLAISPDGRMLYVGYRGENPAVLSFEIGYEICTLTYRGRAALPGSMAHLATDRTGRFLFSASYATGVFGVSGIGADGVPGAVFETFQAGPRAHCVVPARDNRTIYVSSTESDAILAYDFDAQIGRVSPHVEPAMRTSMGAGPRHFTFDAGERFAYVVNQESGTVEVFESGNGKPSRQCLQSVDITGWGFAGDPEAADIHLTPDGRFLYASERTSNTLAGFAVDGATGLLTPIEKITVPPVPRGFAIDPSGRYLLIAGQLSANITQYAIDPDTGALTHMRAVPTGNGPNWIEVLPMPSP